MNTIYINTKPKPVQYHFIEVVDREPQSCKINKHSRYVRKALSVRSRTILPNESARSIRESTPSHIINNKYLMHTVFPMRKNNYQKVMQPTKATSHGEPNR